MSYTQGYEDGVRATKAEYLKLLKEENLHLVKELTDEEIQEIVADKYEKGHGRYIDTDLFFIEFARAILRKAQEK